MTDYEEFIKRKEATFIPQPTSNSDAQVDSKLLDQVEEARSSELIALARAGTLEKELAELREENEAIMDKLMKALAAQSAAAKKQKEAESRLERIKRNSVTTDMAEDISGAVSAMGSAIPDFLSGW